MEEVIATFRADEPAEHSTRYLHDLTRAIIVGLNDNPHLTESLDVPHASSRFLAIAKQPIIDLIGEQRERHGLTEIPFLNYYVSCYLGSLFCTYEEWRGTDEPKESLDEIVDVLYGIMSEGVKSVIKSDALVLEA